MIFAASSDSVFKSADSGASWTSSPTGFGCGGDLEIMVDADSSNIIYLACEIGVLKSNDGGITWFESGPQINVASITALKSIASKPDVLYSAVFGKGLYKSINPLGKILSSTGVEWQRLPDFPGSTSVNDIEINLGEPERVYVLGQPGLGALLHISTDGGSNWTRVSDVLMWTGMDIELGSLWLGGSWEHPDSLIAEKVMAVYKGTEDATNWSKYTLTERMGSAKSIAVNPTNPATVYAGGFNTTDFGGRVPILMKTTDEGATWNEIGSSSIKRLINVVRIDPFNHDKIYVGTEKDSYSPTGGVYISIDGGESWQDPIENSYANDIITDPLTPNVLYAGTTSGVYQSTDGGLSWHELNGELNETDIKCLDLDPVNQVLYAGTNGQGVFRNDLTTGIEERESISPNTVTLFQNYPNPFNLETIISYEIAHTSDVLLSVFDIRGRLVTTLVDGVQIPGQKRAYWDGRDHSGKVVPSGVYISKLTAEDQVTMKKMILQK